VSRFQIAPLSKAFEYVVCCFDVGFNVGDILYCRRDGFLCHPVINLRSTECLAIWSVIICTDICKKGLFLTHLYVSSFKINYHLLGSFTHIHGQIKGIEVEHKIISNIVVFLGLKASRFE